MKHLDTRLAHTGTHSHPDTRPDTHPDSAAIAPPIHLATNFEALPDGSFGTYKYGRLGNPTRRRFEQALADLERADECIAFASGMAGASALLTALDSGDELLLADDVYHGVSLWVDEHFVRWGGRVKRFHAGSRDDLAEKVSDRTRLIWIETPSNPLLQITDISAVANIAHNAGALLVCDSTFSTPYLTRPIEHGADVVLHSATKYLSGHSDALGGAVLFAESGEESDAERAGGSNVSANVSSDRRRSRSGPLAARTRSIQTTGGAVMDPFTAWLTMRGMRSLGARMRMICESAARVADFLAGADGVLEVNYPGLPSHPGHKTAGRQMDAFGGMISFRTDGGEDRARRVVSGADVFTRATSLGGTESLIEHRRTSEGPHSTTPADLIRLSIGLEHPGDLIDDLRAALAA